MGYTDIGGFGWGLQIKQDVDVVYRYKRAWKGLKDQKIMTGRNKHQEWTELGKKFNEQK